VSVLPALLGTQPPHFAWPLPLTVDRSPTQTAPTTETTPELLTAIANSNGTNNGDNACFCLPNFIWSSNACVLAVALDCTTISNANGSNGLSACFCIAGYTWNALLFSCQFDCTVFPYTNGNSGLNSCYVSTWLRSGMELAV
jgi:hypothetical protein